MKKQIDPRMHSAEHILNRTIDSMLGCGRCFSAHIEKKKSKCDYRFDRELTSKDISEIETRIQKVIDDDLLIREEFVSKRQAEKRFDLTGLPDGSGDAIRIIKVGDYDECPCIGPHVKSTKEIGGFRITSTGLHNGALRIRFKL